MTEGRKASRASKPIPPHPHLAQGLNLSLMGSIRPEFFQGLNFATGLVVCITAMINL